MLELCLKVGAERLATERGGKGCLLSSHAECGWGQPAHLRVLMVDLTEAGLLQQDYEKPV